MDTSQLTDKDLLKHCYAKLGAGGGGANPRNIAFGIAENGWFPVLDEYKTMLRFHGMKGLFIHNPWGHDNIWPMEWDQRLLAREYPVLDKVDSTFGPAFYAILLRNPEWKLVFYLGMADHSPEMMKLEKNPTAWWNRWTFSIQPILDLARDFPRRITIITDSGSDLSEEENHYLGMRSLEAIGIKQGIEMRPLRGFEHLRDLDTCLLFGVDVGGARDPVLDAKERAKRYTDSELWGTQYCHMNHPNSNFTNVRTVLERGCVPIVTPQSFKMK